MKKIDRDCTPEQTEFDYPTMTITEIEELKIPAADECHIWLWTTRQQSNQAQAIETALIEYYNIDMTDDKKKSV